ncbi:phosphoribosylformylglycinamidine synthase subunit PurQ [Afifella marina]|uniref:Phosphoribosylformylglycinamidine synthase subunit PurQ n=1 Tax=Afifella marina DSM 2698 TaxID=1120955 RepID=A0A1G5P9Y7_AFIMA|nr:phosphoribosylformylglycinamidine synthase subunit PurQ [Afifella marina]MBK1625346.1 phosphoribosylformylglycinamidine synthase I [Afifella marina DSM 2698]MBK1628888.1 phosphoribosylformylglycinamidine synthase I [Afifella marina]MBK5916890.1 phosphoribosylformylglycinamidine synthase I [Afifella marina]RAI17896.1 phosphoribosylformylglycinamidine synthase I [Afifella marina DSM 2698]SCZ45919.1 phosphoribosylformylglycinamidine synthase [Afifella marina DSM 2698]
MKAAIIQFPGTNREGDMAAALRLVSGRDADIVWHGETSLPAGVDLIVLPGGFSFGDYLRSGAIAAHSPVMRDVAKRAEDGVMVLGVCNGFQALCEAGLLPGALMRNASLKFVCREVKLKVTNTATPFTSLYRSGQVIRCPVAHADGNYFADAETLDQLEAEDRVVFRYADGTNPNGSQRDIAGITNERRNVLGMMPHPEDLVEAAHGGDDGLALFKGLVEGLQEKAA